MLSKIISTYRFKILYWVVILIVMLVVDKVQGIKLRAESRGYSSLTKVEQNLLNLTPVQIQKAELSPQAVQQYWEEHGVTSASKKGEDPFDTPSAIYVISQEDIRNSGVTSVPEALRMVPGLQVAQIDSHSWAISSRGFNRQYSSRLRVLIDGKAVIYPLFSGVFWEEQDVVLEDIDRIEVIRGPGGTTWGENAITGIINIITKHAKNTVGTYLSTTYGDHHRHIVEARHGHQLAENTYARTYLKYTEREASKQLGAGNRNDEWSNSKAGIRLDHQFHNQQLTVHANIHRGTDGEYFSYIPTLAEPYQQEDKKDRETDNVSLLLNWKMVNGTTANTLQTYIDYYKTHVGSNNDVLDIHFLNYDIDFQQTTQWASRQEVSWGMGYHLYQDKVLGMDQLIYTPTHLTGSRYNSFIQNTSELMENVLYLTLGSKIEHHYYTGLEYQPSIKLAWYPSDKETVWASVARAVRAPTRFERGAEQRVRGTEDGYIGVIGDEQFEAEKSVSYEIGYRVKPHLGIMVDSTLFFATYTDLRSYSPIATYEDIAVPLLVTNNASGSSYGLEIAAQWQINSRWRVEGAYSFFDIEFDVPETDNFADGLGNPEHQFNIRSHVKITPSITFDTNWYFVDTLEVNEFQKEKIPSYHRLDAQLSWGILPNMMVHIVGQNLLDEHHQEFSERFLSTPGEISRNLYTKLTWEF